MAKHRVPRQRWVLFIGVLLFKTLELNGLQCLDSKNMSERQSLSPGGFGGGRILVGGYDCAKSPPQRVLSVWQCSKREKYVSIDFASKKYLVLYLWVNVTTAHYLSYAGCKLHTS